MLAKANRAGDTKGFLALANAGRPDLSVEAVVLSPQFRHLFSPEELAIAEQRLHGFPVFAWRKNVDRGPNYPDAAQPLGQFPVSRQRRMMPAGGFEWL